MLFTFYRKEGCVINNFKMKEKGLKLMVLFTVEEKDLSIYFVAVKGLIKVNPKFFYLESKG